MEIGNFVLPFFASGVFLANLNFSTDRITLRDISPIFETTKKLGQNNRKFFPTSHFFACKKVWGGNIKNLVH